MKVVLDTNIIVSGLPQFKRNPAKVLELALAGALQVCYDALMIEEYREVLARRRFHLADYPADKRRGAVVLTPVKFMEQWRAINS
jgi:uncharacterized protein